MMPRRICCAAALMLAVMMPGGCAASRAPRFVVLPASGVRPVRRVDMIFDDRVAVATIASIVHDALRVPAFPVTFEIHPDRHAFERALLGRGYDAALARSTASTMVAVAGHRRVLINGQGFGAMPTVDRVMLLAHELGHSLQYELGGGHRGTSDQWLREGFADWLAIQVLERLDAMTLDAFRRSRQREIAAAGQARSPSLGEIVTFADWVRAGERNGALLYAYAFMAADLLIEQHGVQRVLHYFARFSRSQDRSAHFAASFGQSPQEFERKLRQRLWRR